jgi:hypothetical protein
MLELAVGAALPYLKPAIVLDHADHDHVEQLAGANGGGYAAA